MSSHSQKPQVVLDACDHQSFIDTIREIPALWNNQRCAPDVKRSLWERVGKQFNLNVNQAIREWAAIREKYRRLRAKLAQPTQAKRLRTIHRKWPLYDSLSFLNAIKKNIQLDNVTGELVREIFNKYNFGGVADTESNAIDETRKIEAGSPSDERIQDADESNDETIVEVFKDVYLIVESNGKNSTPNVDDDEMAEQPDGDGDDEVGTSQAVVEDHMQTKYDTKCHAFGKYIGEELSMLPTNLGDSAIADILMRLLEAKKKQNTS